MTVTKRRLSSTETIQHLWDAIVSIRQQKQIPNFERISNYMRRKHNISPSDLEKQLDYAVQDSLIEMKKRLGCKGSKVGVEQEAYRIPDQDVEKDDHDWYCFECHKEGEVIDCSTCHRVYHNSCIKDEQMENEKLICDVCKMIKGKEVLKIKRDDLNTLLSYTCLRLKDKVCGETGSVADKRLFGRPTMLIDAKLDGMQRALQQSLKEASGNSQCKQSRELHKMPNTEEEQWRHNYLIYEKMDLVAMEEKTQDNAYRRLEDFQADAQTIVHNVVLYYGVHSTMADMARQMLRDCIYDLGEIRQCRDCYRMSNEKRDKFWFCQPCDPPHELVFAKQKGFPYWPAKIIRVDNGLYDVRFFGGYHQRANIEKEYIKPITTSLQQLQLKRTASLNRALEELKRHQQLLGQAPNKELTAKGSKKTRSRPASSSSSRSGSGSRSRSRKGSISSADGEDDRSLSENEAEDGNLSNDECPSSSSPKVARFQDAPTPEDHNVVSSSSQESPNAKVTVSTQTHKKLLAGLIPQKPPPVKPEEKETSPSCNCETKYSKMFKEFKERLETDQREDKERSLRELAERLRQDFDEEKQKLVTAALEKLQQEVEEAKRKSEEQLRASQQMEMKEVLDRHRMEISETKKKQWCYNCEAEAIYHCCWNTSYCSVDCQQVHWHKEHKRTCRRKR